MAQPSVRLEGLEPILKKLSGIEDANDILARGLVRGALEVKGDIGEDMRVATGNLRASWQAAVPRVERSGGGVRVVIGTNVDYAPFVGDRSTPTGDSYGLHYVQKWLERDSDKVVRIVAEEVRRALGG